MMRNIYIVLCTIVMGLYAVIAYALCYTDHSIGGHLYFAIMALGPLFGSAALGIYRETF